MKSAVDAVRVGDDGLQSAIYSGAVRHRRFGDPSHEFTFPLFMMYLDLDELPHLFDRHLLWSARHPAPLWFRRSDYLGDSHIPLDRAVRDRAEALTGVRPSGPIRMLTHLRTFGLIMNPVTFYYCFAPEGEVVDTILAEITNTPWKERHTYAVTGDLSHPATGLRHPVRKSFHVSPFMPMDQEYVWSFSSPAEKLTVHMENWREGARVFDATLSLMRKEMTSRSLRSALLRHPLMTLKVAAGIYAHAARLRIKGAPFHPHPGKSGDLGAVPEEESGNTPASIHTT